MKCRQVDRVTPQADRAAGGERSLLLVRRRRLPNRGRKIPDDVAILGVDNDELTVAMARPALSSIELPGFRIGEEAAALLAALMGGARVPPVPRLLPRRA
jgi:LacI family transcriptional regulator